MSTNPSEPDLQAERQVTNFQSFLDKHQPVLVVEFASVIDERWILDSCFLSTPVPIEDYEPIYTRKVSGINNVQP